MEEGRALGGQWERQLRGWVSGQESLGFCRFQLLSRKSIAILSTASWVSFDLALNCGVHLLYYVLSMMLSLPLSVILLMASAFSANLWQ